MSDADKPKIIVDEDWKAQVKAEKHAAGSPATAATKSSGPSTPRSADKADSADVPLPPPSLAFLFTTLATQAMIALGQVPNPFTGKTEVRSHQAKHFIDTLSLLEEKTAGNRTADESSLLSDLLHQLRMAYVLLGESVKET